MARTQRIRRKELRQPDEFQTLTRRAFTFAEGNRSMVYLALGVAVLLLAAVVAYRAVRTSREGSAAEAYRQAHVLLQDRKYAEAATAFQQAAGGYSGSDHGVLAQLQAGNAFLLASQPVEAATAYQKFLTAGSASPDLRQLAHTRRGNALEESGKSGEAATEYAAAAAMSGPYTEEALLGEARVAEAGGDGARAKGIYEQVLDKFPETASRSLVQARLSALGWTPPVEGDDEHEEGAAADEDAAESAGDSDGEGEAVADDGADAPAE